MEEASHETVAEYVDAVPVAVLVDTVGC